MIEAAGIRQRLVAILAADAVGYSRLMALDERATVASLDSARHAFRAAIDAHGGRVVDTAGDSVLAVFETTSGAVTAALEIQHGLEGLTAELPEDRRMRFRIGIHIGDVIEKDDGSVYGDGVNIAARLEGLAEPGGIAVSDAVRGSLRRRIPGTFEDLGAQNVKNIADPVHAFRFVSGSTLPGSGGGKPSPSGRFRRLGFLAAAAVLAGIAAILFFRLKGTPEAQTVSGPLLLSVAVLPFTISDSASGVPIATSFTQAVTAGLAQAVPGKAVISFDTADRYRGNLDDVRAVGKELGVRYLAQGDLRRENGQFVVAARLVDTQTRAQVWSARIATPESRLVETPDLPVLRVLSALRVALYRAEVQRLPSQASRDASASELAFRGLYKNSSGDPKESFDKTREQCDAALQLDPALPAALICKAQVVEATLFSPTPFAKTPNFTSTLDQRRLLEMDELTQHAVAMDGRDSNAWNARADALRWQHRWDGVAEARRRAIELAPSRASTYGALAWDLIYMGEPTQALTALTKEADIDPDIVRGDNYQSAVCRARVALAQLEEAIASCEKAASGGGGEDAGTQVFLAVAYATKGDMTKARIARDRANALLGRITIESWKVLCSQFSDKAPYWEQQERYILPGMRRAGFAEN